MFDVEGAMLEGGVLPAEDLLELVAERPRARLGHGAVRQVQPREVDEHVV